VDAIVLRLVKQQRNPCAVSIRVPYQYGEVNFFPAPEVADIGEASFAVGIAAVIKIIVK
jgi:hypothetical protein